jgi:hypothetical protein
MLLFLSQQRVEMCCTVIVPGSKTEMLNVRTFLGFRLKMAVA